MLSLAACVCLFYLFLEKRRIVPSLMIALYSIHLAVSAGALYWCFILTDADVGGHVLRLSTYDLVFSIVAAAVWIPYFLTSRRVARTFIN